VLRSEPGQPESRSRGEHVVPWVGMWTGEGGSSCEITTKKKYGSSSFNTDKQITLMRTSIPTLIKKYTQELTLRNLHG
jgi:hypothetical protein